MFWPEPYKKTRMLSAKKWQTTNPIPEISVGKLHIKKKKLPKGKQLEMSNSSRVEFDGDVTFTVLTEGKGNTWDTIWMSDTPMEARTNSRAIKEANGHVLIAGLGIGYTLLQMVKKRKVKTITVLENNQKLIDLVWPYLEPHMKGKVTVVCTSVFDYEPPMKTYYDYIWFDIWESLDAYEYDQAKLVEKYFANADSENMRFWGER